MWYRHVSLIWQTSSPTDALPGVHSRTAHLEGSLFGTALGSVNAAVPRQASCVFKGRKDGSHFLPRNDASEDTMFKKELAPLPIELQ